MALDNAVDTTAGAGADELAAPSAFQEAAWKSVARHYQLTLAVAVVLAFAALAAGFAVGEPLGGAFAVIGLILGGYNGRRLWTETTGLKGAITDARRAMALSSLRRLGFVTMLAFLIALVYRQDGWAVFVGLMTFQLLMVSMLARPLRHVVRL